MFNCFDWLAGLCNSFVNYNIMSWGLGTFSWPPSDLQLIVFFFLPGGLENKGQEVALRKNPDVIVATPGRLVDHLRNTPSFSLQNIEILVLDEADRCVCGGGWVCACRILYLYKFSFRPNAVLMGMVHYMPSVERNCLLHSGLCGV